MKTKSKSKQRAAGAALAAQRAETNVTSLEGASKEMYESMTEDELEDMASAKHDGKPERDES